MDTHAPFCQTTNLQSLPFIITIILIIPVYIIPVYIIPVYIIPVYIYVFFCVLIAPEILNYEPISTQADMW